MGTPIVQEINVPDVGAGTGPWASPAWVAGTFEYLLRAGLPTKNPADVVVLLGSATGPAGTDPISLANPNQLATFTSDGEQFAELIGVQACAFYALIRLPPPPATVPPVAPTGAPTVSAKFYLTGIDTDGTTPPASTALTMVDSRTVTGAGAPVQATAVIGVGWLTLMNLSPNATDIVNIWTDNTVSVANGGIPGGASRSVQYKDTSSIWVFIPSRVSLSVIVEK